MSRLRREVQDLSKRARHGDAHAARALLSHSVRMGHDRLAVRRLFLAHAMGARDFGEDAQYCARIILTLPDETVEKMALDARNAARIYTARKSA